jgi:hypothetical protein
MPAPPLPQPISPPVRERTEYGLSTVGANGRLNDRTVLRRLGWCPGTRLDMREDHGLVVVRADPRAVFRVSAQGFLLLPATLRRWCQLADGDRVLLVADPQAAWLVIHPPASVAAMVTAAHTRVWGGEAR